MIPTPRTIAALVLVVLTVACAPSPENDAVATVGNPELGLALAAVPPPFEVVRNQGRELELALAGDATTGAVRIDSLERDGAVNLVAEVQAHQERIEAREGGEYKGGQELVCQLGTAFWSRGRYPGAQGPLEEACVFALHPSQNAVLSLCYVYPAGDDSGSRVEQLLGVLGEVETASEPTP